MILVAIVSTQISACQADSKPAAKAREPLETHDEPAPETTEAAEPGAASLPSATDSAARTSAAEVGDSIGESSADYACFVARHAGAATDLDRQTAPPPTTRAPIGGTIDVARARDVFTNGYDELKVCYECALMRDAELKGRVTVAVRIEPSGSPSEVEITSRDMVDSTMFGCLRRQIKRWRFPAATGGAVRVRKPYQFSQEM